MSMSAAPRSLQLDASPSDCERMVTVCLPYLSSDMPVELQEVCRESIRVVGGTHPDRVWILLAQLCDPATIPHPPHNSLVPIKVSLCRMTKSGVMYEYFLLLLLLLAPPLSYQPVPEHRSIVVMYCH